MAKFIKRLKKSIGTVENALIIGTAFGYLDQLPDHFNTVFVHNKNNNIRKKNLVRIDSFDDIEISNSIHVVFFDLDYLPHIDKITGVLTRQRPYLIVEGNEVVERSNVECLYKAGYRAIEKLGMFHIWKMIK